MTATQSSDLAAAGLAACGPLPSDGGAATGELRDRLLASPSLAHSEPGPAAASRARKPRLVMTQSAVKSLQQCPLRYSLRYRDLWRPIDEGPHLRIGTAMHIYWERTLRGDSHELAMDAVMGHIARKPLAEPADVALVQAMCAAYSARYADSPLVPLVVDGEPCVEKQFSGKVTDPGTGRVLRGVRFEGKIDVIVDTPDGPMVCDHKTTGGPIAGPYQEAVWGDFQLRAYAMAARDYLGIPVVGALYDVVSKSKLRLRQGEEPSSLLARQVEQYRERGDDMFARIPVFFTDAHIASARQEVADAVRMHRMLQYRGWWPGNRTQCRDKVTGRKACEFLEYCEAGRDMGVLAMYMERGQTAHTELSDDPAS